MHTFVNVFKKEIEVYITGNGQKTLVIQTGMSCSFYDWIPIAEQLSTNYKVVLFHRPGYGASLYSKEARTTKQAAEELAELLHVLHIKEPITLAGHSYGGLCAQQFAINYPHKLENLVLIDSTSMNLHRLDDLHLPISDETDSDEKWLQTYRDYAAMTQNELQHILQPTLSSRHSRLPKEIQRHCLHFSTSPTLYKAVLSEMTNWKQCALQLKKDCKLLHVPLLVIGRDANYSIQQMTKNGMPLEEATLLETLWQELIEEQTTLSTNSKKMIAERAGHSIEQDRPDFLIETLSSISG
ncbi:alpha/beta hydrolase [Bacillus manliponensis]|uniref:Alpha/beta hydrolase n=1 Tax=Bacillus manliponensis TaxID=574376 RepID=A0A073K036_9BACI|nr:alpha/beta hydrolase [Bacillus manliponensis]KEK20684.1 alpha/beta hydrolase [Bacillus manliponensis]